MTPKLPSSLAPSATRATLRLLAFLAALCAGLVAPQSGAAEATKKFALAAGDAAETLQKFADQSGEQVVYPPSEVRGVRTHAVAGELTAVAALRQMLAGTVLSVLHDKRTGALAVKRDAAPNAPRAVPAPNGDRPGPGGAGTITGRVQDGAGRFLPNARIVVAGTNREAFTNTAGEYALGDLPAGPVTLRVTYTGRSAQVAEVTVTPGREAKRDFALRDVFDKSAPADRDTVVLDQFVVSSQRAQNAAEIAINEQRVSANIKSVVSTEAFGDIAQNNIGEFLKYLPGVEAVYGDMNIGGVQLRGMPANQTNISIDGGGISVAGSGGATRSLNFQTISLNNVSRIEVSKVVLPDQRADSLGGTINLVSRTAFERSRPEFSYKSFLNMNANAADWKPTAWGQRGGGGNRRKWFPDFEVNYVNPVTKNIGIAVNATRNDQFTLSRRLTNGYSIANTSAAAPYLQAYTLLNYPSFEERSTAGLKVDWRLAPRDVLSLSLNTNYYFSNFEQHVLQYQANTMAVAPATGRTPASGDFSDTFVLGRPGQGSVTQTLQTNYGAQANHVGRLGYRHTGVLWDVDGAVGGNRSKLWYRNESYGQLQQSRVQLTGVTVRYDDINRFGPGRITVTNPTTGAVVDPLVLSNYNVINPMFSQDRDSRANARNADLNVKRKFETTTFPAALKAGLAYRSDARDVMIWRKTPFVTYLGPDGRAGTGDEGVAGLPAGALLDPNFSVYPLTRNYAAPQWVSAKKVYDLYYQHPGFFSYPVATQASDYTGTVDSTEELAEKVSAGYLMGDISLWRRRLRLVGGLRAERWAFEGRGVLIDVTRQYQKDANGKLIDGNPTQAGVQFVPITTDALAVAKLTHLELGNSIEKSYEHYFPSLSGSLIVTENSLFRFGYAKTIGRPDFANYLPTININRVNNAGDSATGAGLGTINAKNPALKPWLAHNFDLSLEYYTRQGGVFSVGVFRKQITDFFSSVSSIASEDFLNRIGLPDTYLNYLVITPGNVTGVTHMSGLEAAVQQKLSSQLSVFANVSVNRNKGAVDADFRGYVRQRVNAGFNYSWQRFAGMVKFYYTGKVRGVANPNIAADGWLYVLSKPRIDASLDYRITPRVTAFLAGRNIFNDRDQQELYGSATPAYARFNVESEYGVLFQIGVRGSF